MATIELQTTAELAESRRKMQAKRRMKNRIALALSMATMAFGLFWLIWILMATITRGFDGMSLALFTEMTPPPNTAGGGLANALAGSGLLILGNRIWYAAGYPRRNLSGGIWPQVGAGGNHPLYQRHSAFRAVYRGGSVRLHHCGGADAALLELGGRYRAGAAAGAYRYSYHRKHAEAGAG